MGANIELNAASLSHTVHAEQSAISHAWLAGEKSITDIIVNETLCGFCRQFTNEITDGCDIRISLPNKESQVLSHYLPYSFGPKNLNITKALLSEQNHPMNIDTTDPMILETLEQARSSYAPYTHNYSAVVLKTQDGQMFQGRYAENAAFNPTLNPMQMALSTMIRHDRKFEEIVRAVVVESAEGKNSIVSFCADALKCVAPGVKLESYTAE